MEGPSKKSKVAYRLIPRGVRDQIAEYVASQEEHDRGSQDDLMFMERMRAVLGSQPDLPRRRNDYALDFMEEASAAGAPNYDLVARLRQRALESMERDLPVIPHEPDTADALRAFFVRAQQEMERFQASNKPPQDYYQLARKRQDFLGRVWYEGNTPNQLRFVDNQMRQLQTGRARRYAERMQQVKESLP